MKKVLSIVLSLGVFTALGASRATLFLEGYIEEFCEIYIDPVLTNSTALDIVNGETARTVANVTESSNSASGYFVYLSSVNGGLLCDSTQACSAATSTAYTVDYTPTAGTGGTAFAPFLEDADGDSTDGTLINTVAGPLAGIVANPAVLAVNVTAGPTLGAGAYTDTLILGMVAQ